MNEWLAKLRRDYRVKPIATGDEFIYECREMANELEKVGSRLGRGTSSIVGNYFREESLCERSVGQTTFRLLLALVSGGSVLGIAVEDTAWVLAGIPRLTSLPCTVQLSFGQNTYGHNDLRELISVHSSGALSVNVPDQGHPLYLLSPQSLHQIVSRDHQGDRLCTSVRLILDLDAEPKKWTDTAYAAT